ncbi:hypothetical protein WJX73_010433 [Symbiochloris irregularis]|uniref:DNA 3'-5' helicase n=1 Tax=Symbiochloris irregularis TaxID=706552 RepID=A0AAW1NRA6_9CHLO
MPASGPRGNDLGDPSGKQASSSKSRQEASAPSAPAANALNTAAGIFLLPGQTQNGRQLAGPASPGLGLFTPPQLERQRKRPASSFSADRPLSGDRQPARVRRRLNLSRLPELNDQQQAAVRSPIDEPSLIIAGAGSGKTTVMLARLRHMLDQGIPPDKILMVTFSRKAAGDLKRRLIESNKPGARKVTASTFHGFCFRLIHQNYLRLGFTAPPTIWGEVNDIRAIVKEAIRKAALEAARQRALQWMRGIDGLNPHSTWEDILQAVHTHHPNVYAGCKAQADVTMQAERAKQDTKQRKLAEKQAQGLSQAAGKGVDSASALQAALDRASLMEMCTLVYDVLHWHYTSQRQQAPRAGDVPDAEKVKNTKEMIFMCKNRGHVVSMYDASGSVQAGSAAVREFGAIWKAYQDILRSCNACDYDDLLSLAVELLSTDQEVLAGERERFQMLLVDEFQDCNPAQIALVELLQQGRGFVTAVGDNMQSIYGFRGADHRSFQLFEQAFAPPQQGHSIRRPLDVNHRSTPEILQAANAAAAGTQPEYVQDKVLMPSKPSRNNPVQLLSYSDPEHAAGQMVEQMQALQAAGTPYERMAVLLASLGNGRTAALQAELGRRGIKYQVMKEKPFFEIDKVKDAMAHLQLAVNPHDDLAFQRLLDRPPRRLGEAFVETLRREQAALALQRQQTHVSLYEAAVSLSQGPSLTAAVRLNLNAFLNFLDQAGAECLGKSPSQALFYLLKRSSYLEWQKKQNDKKRKDKRQRQQSKVTRRQPGDSDDSSGDDDDQYGNGVSSDEEDEQSTWSKEADLELQEADKRLHQLYGMAVRHETEWRNPWAAMDAPPELGPASLQSVCMEVARKSVPADRVLQQLPDDLQQRTFAGKGPLALLDFIGRCALDAPDPREGKQQQGVYIGTVHSAKGLEWDAVWVRSHEGGGDLPFPYRDPGSLPPMPPAPTADHPYLQSIRKHLLATREEHDAEGQRLVYVALTRAREHLFLYTERSKYKFSSAQWAPRCAYFRPSPFVSKIRRNAPDCCEVKVGRTQREIQAGMPENWQHV